jgi:hypothetical protein
VLSGLNLGGAGFAIGTGEPSHAFAHVLGAGAFAIWAGFLRRQSREEVALETPAGLDALEEEVNRLRQELSETQERLDFTERMLAQRPDPRRVDPER